MLGAQLEELGYFSAACQISERIHLAITVENTAERRVSTLRGVELRVKKLHKWCVCTVVADGFGARFRIRDENSSCAADT